MPHSHPSTMPRALRAGVALLVCLSFVLPFWPQGASAAGASLFLAPSAATVAPGASFNVNVKVNTGGEVINAAQGAITFDTALLEVKSVSKGGSIFTLWTVEPTAGGGSINFGGGIPRPGYKGASGQIFTISFKAKKAGKATVRFSSGAVLANDGKGTNILSGLGSGTYTIAAKTDTPASKPDVTPSADEPDEPQGPYNLPVIISSTHPDQNRWYISREAQFAWTLPTGVTGVSLSLTPEAIADPGSVSDGLLDKHALTIEKDGIWYLHVKFKDAKRWGSTAHYRLMVDATPPEPFTVGIERTSSSSRPTLKFEATDSGAGLEKYILLVGSLESQAHELPATTNLLELKDLSAGDHVALVRAIDKAGNERVVTVEFRIEPIAAPVITEYPAEVKPGDRFYAAGTATANGTVRVHLEADGKEAGSGSAPVDGSGRWLYLHPEALLDGRYAAWAEASNVEGIGSGPSERVTFLVTKPVFARLGSFVLDYVTVFISLLALILLIIVLALWLFGFFRKKLKKETVEIETVLKQNLAELESEIASELIALTKKTKTGAEARDEAGARIKAHLDGAEANILKEIKDVERMVK